MKKLPLRLLFLIVSCLAVVAFAQIESELSTAASKPPEEPNHNKDLSSVARAAGQEDGSSQCGPPNYRCSYDGTDPKPLCTDCAFPPVPDMSARPNAVWYDKGLGVTGKGNQVVRCTYPETTPNSNSGFGIGFGGSGDTHALSMGGGFPFSYRLIIGNSEGGYPFTFLPDLVHPKCYPTYPIGAFRVAD